MKVGVGGGGTSANVWRWGVGMCQGLSEQEWSERLRGGLVGGYEWFWETTEGEKKGKEREKREKEWQEVQTYFNHFAFLKKKSLLPYSSTTCKGGLFHTLRYSSNQNENTRHTV